MVTALCGSAQSNPLNLASSFVECMSDDCATKSVVDDYGLVSDGELDQSKALQEAIYSFSKEGGGKLIIPKGTYCFANVYLASDVHLLVEKETVLRPYIARPNSSSAVVMLMLSGDDKSADGYIENCSLRGLDGEFYVDYSHLPSGDVSKMRFVINRRVRNFLISDVIIKDNYTQFCAIVFTSAPEPKGANWDVVRPTNGEIRNCSILNANAGYGLCQFHGAQSIYLTDIYAKGGITLRLESDSGDNAGVYDIQARNVGNEDGVSAVMMNPHGYHNGTVLVDGIWSKNSIFAVFVRRGFIDAKNLHNPDAEIGTYASDSKMINIHAEFGKRGQLVNNDVWALEPDMHKYIKAVKVDGYDGKMILGPSIAPVWNDTRDHYTVTFEGVTSTGFKHHENSVLLTEQIIDREVTRATVTGTIKAYQDPDIVAAAKAADAKRAAKVEQYRRLQEGK